MNMFEKVREWGKLRGVDSVDSDTQYQRFLQEAVEIHDAMIKGDIEAFDDAIGDTIVTLINLANTKGLKAENCLENAYEVIANRKGLTTDKGDFIRYAKLSEQDRLECDLRQGNPGCEYFDNSVELATEDFLR